MTVPLPLSVQVQYSGPGSWEAAGVCRGLAGPPSWPQKELLHNSGTFQCHLACPRKPIFVSYPCAGSRAQNYFRFADDHAMKRMSAQEAKELPSVLCLYLKHYLEGWLFSGASWPSSVTLRMVTYTFLKVTLIIPSRNDRGSKDWPNCAIKYWSHSAFHVVGTEWSFTVNM